MTNATPGHQPIDHLATRFRQLRAAWFANHLQSHAHERVWETEEDERHRITDNQKMRTEFDKQTEAIIEGSVLYQVSPCCPADLHPSGTTSETTP